MILIDNNQTFTINGTSVLEVHKELALHGDRITNIQYKIICDFTNIPSEHHELVKNFLISL